MEPGTFLQIFAHATSLNKRSLKLKLLLVSCWWDQCRRYPQHPLFSIWIWIKRHCRECLAILEHGARYVDWNARRGTQAVQCRSFVCVGVNTMLLSLHIDEYHLAYGLLLSAATRNSPLNHRFVYSTMHRYHLLCCTLNPPDAAMRHLRFSLLIIVATTNTAAAVDAGTAASAGDAIIILCTVYVCHLSHVMLHAIAGTQCERRGSRVLFTCALSVKWHQTGN